MGKGWRSTYLTVFLACVLSRSDLRCKDFSSLSRRSLLKLIVWWAQERTRNKTWGFYVSLRFKLYLSPLVFFFFLLYVLSFLHSLSTWSEINMIYAYTSSLYYRNWTSILSFLLCRRSFLNPIQQDLSLPHAHYAVQAEYFFPIQSLKK